MQWGSLWLLVVLMDFTFARDNNFDANKRSDFPLSTGRAFSNEGVAANTEPTSETISASNTLGIEGNYTTTTELVAINTSTNASVDHEFPLSRAPDAKEDAASRSGPAQIVQFLIGKWGPEQAYKSVVQILFFHLFISAFYYLFFVLHQGVLKLITLLRSPIIDYEELLAKIMTGYPEPELPHPHEEYGYTGGFKPPIGHHEGPPKLGEKPKDGPKPEPKPKDGPKPEPKPKDDPKLEKKPVGPPKPVYPPQPVYHPVQGLQPFEPQYGDPLDGQLASGFKVFNDGHHSPSFDVIHDPPILDPLQVSPKGGLGGSSYTSYAGEVKPVQFQAGR
ncbi:uncharacterized protein LOC108674475 [Hyalella azteca]|uniref:Uncharacterized protein LOC108674475 n=1 Tax=Hyalella azteca TaxID=294128 RepID=A0A8B7NVZ2_HYAAZ|nr:uncharacterized protein LOC108674475 [Hyalella azteca]